MSTSSASDISDTKGFSDDEASAYVASRRRSVASLTPPSTQSEYHAPGCVGIAIGSISVRTRISVGRRTPARASSVSTRARIASCASSNRRARSVTVADAVFIADVNAAATPSFRAASSAATRPPFTVLVASAPDASNSFTTSSRPRHDAKNSAVAPYSSDASTSTPASIKARRRSASPSLAAANIASERFGRELPSAIDAVARGPSALNFGAVPFFFCLTTVGERSSHFAFDAAATSAGEGEGGDAFVERRRGRVLKARGGRRDAPGKVLKDRRSQRRRSRMGTSV
eukprot:30956-Pelagococcus_subviridis.AAC.3